MLVIPGEILVGFQVLPVAAPWGVAPYSLVGLLTASIFRTIISRLCII